MNQYFSNDDYLLFVYNGEESKEAKPLYSRYEEYTLYKGMNRFDEHPDEYEYYTKIYIRADLKKTVIKRKYQKFMEFYADASSLLIAIFAILEVIFNYINTFYAYHSLSKLIFFVKDLDEKNSFNIFKKRQKILDILYITGLNKSNNNSFKFNYKDSKMNKLFSSNIKDSERINILENNKKDYQDEIRIYNNKKNLYEFNNIIKIKNNFGNQLEIDSLKNNKILKSKNNDINCNTCKNFHSNEFKENEDNKNPKSRKKHYSISKLSEAMIYFDQKEKENNSSDSKGTNMNDISPESSHDKKKVTRAYNSFNIFEIIITEFLKCCQTKEMEIKSNANEKANNYIYEKMDILTYVRNMILFDLINKIILDDNKKTIMNFLSRPIISLNKDLEYEFDEFYGKYRERDFKIFSKKLKDLSQNKDKDDNENKLISITNANLRIFV